MPTDCSMKSCRSLSVVVDTEVLPTESVSDTEDREMPAVNSVPNKQVSRVRDVTGITEEMPAVHGPSQLMSLVNEHK